jgi:hypothetical protein
VLGATGARARATFGNARVAAVREGWIPDHDQKTAPGVLALFTSDGVHDAVPLDELVTLECSHPDPQHLADAIVVVARADDTGYCDDATVVILAAG